MDPIDDELALMAAGVGVIETALIEGWALIRAAGRWLLLLAVAISSWERAEAYALTRAEIGRSPA